MASAAKIMTGLTTADVSNVNAKVYLTKDVNAGRWPTAASVSTAG